MLKLAFFSLLAFGVTLFVIAKALHAIANKKKYRFGFLDGGLLFKDKEINPRWMLLIAALYFGLVCALLAWPLGVYEWYAEHTSPCRDLITEEEVTAVAPDFSTFRIHHMDSQCRMSAWDQGVTGRFESVIGSRFAVNDFRRDLARANGVVSEERPDYFRVDRGHEVDLYLFQDGGGAKLTLSKTQFEQSMSDFEQKLTARAPALIAPFVETYREEEANRGKRGIFDRRNILWFFGAFWVLLFAGAGVWRWRKSREFRRILEEDD